MTTHADHHHHDHHHDHAVFEFESVNTSFIIAVAVNLGFTVLEAVYGIITDSVSLLGDAGHNLSDVLGLLLAWGASYLATQQTSASYSYGYRKSTVLAAVINAVILILTAGYIAFESVERLLTPTPIAEFEVMVVAGIGIFVNAGTALLFMKGSSHDLNLRGAFLHLAYDAAISAGVVVGAFIILVTGMNWIDPLLGLGIVAVILLGTWGLLRDSVNMIIDAVPHGIELEEVRAFLEEQEGVTGIHDLHVWAMSTRETCLTAHLVMPETSLWSDPEGYSRISDELEHRFNIQHVTLQVERDHDTACATDCD
ncbi:MAG: cation transporter [Pseudomonadales bacterium]|nr:cation transporter [Pseudomonadales bacterium]